MTDDDRGTCTGCPASRDGCRGLYFVGGRHCCERCTGDHDPKENSA